MTPTEKHRYEDGDRLGIVDNLPVKTKEESVESRDSLAFIMGIVFVLIGWVAYWVLR